MSVAIIIYVIVCILVGIGLGLLRGLYRTLVRCAAGLTAAVLAVFSTKLLAPLFSGTVENILRNILTLSGLSADDLYTSYPVLAAYIGNMTTAVAAIPLYLLMLVLFSLIMYLVYIAVKSTAMKNVTEKPILKIPAAAIGAVMGLLVSLLIISPVAGTVDIVYRADNVLSAQPETADIADTVKTVHNNGFMRLSYSAPYSMMFDYVTTSGNDETRCRLRNDAGVLCEMAGYIVSLSDKKISEFGTAEAEALDGAVGTLKNADSPALKNALAEVISVSAQKISAGEPVFGMETDKILPALGNDSSTAQVKDAVVQYLGTVDGTTLDSDLCTMSDLAGSLIESGILKENTDFTALSESLQTPGVISGMLNPLLSDERSERVADAIVVAGLNLSAAKIGIPADAAAVYTEFIDSLAAIQAGDSSDDKSGDISDAVYSSGISVSDPVKDMLADYICNNPSLSGADALKGFATAVTSDPVSPDITLPDGFTLTQSDKDALNQILDGKPFPTDNVTVELISANLNGNAGSTGTNTPEREAQLLENAVVAIMELYTKVQSGVSGQSVKESVETLGVILENLFACDTFSDEAVINLTSGFLQNTDIVKDARARQQICGRIQALVGSASGPDDMKALLAGISSSADIVTKLSAGEKVDQATVESLLSNIDLYTTDVLKSLVSLGMLTAGGLEGEQAEKLQSFLQALLANIPTEAMTAEALQNEAKAISVLFSFASGITSGSVSLFDSPTASDEAQIAVDSMLTSSIVINTAHDVTTGVSGSIILDPYAIAAAISDNDRTVLTNALNKAYAAETAAGKPHNSSNLAALILGVSLT